MKSFAANAWLDLHYPLHPSTPCRSCVPYTMRIWRSQCPFFLMLYEFLSSAPGIVPAICSKLLLLVSVIVALSPVFFVGNRTTTNAKRYCCCIHNCCCCASADGDAAASLLHALNAISLVINQPKSTLNLFNSFVRALWPFTLIVCVSLCRCVRVFV